MYLGGEKIPQQKLPLSKKNKKWREACVNAFVDMSNNSLVGRKEDLRRLYDYYNGIIEEEDYRYVLKPYGKTRKNFPSKMRNYPIIKPVIDLLLGEKSKRPLTYTVTVQNSDTVSEKENAKMQLIMSNLEQRFINAMNEAGVETGMPTQEVQLPEHIASQFEDSYVDNRAIKGQYGLNYIIQQQEVNHKFNKAWFHYLVTGEVYSHRGVRNNEPFYEILNPIDIDFDKDPDLEFVEDGDWALIRKYVHASTAIDHYHEFLTDQQVLELEEPRQSDIDSHLLFRASTSNQDPNVHRNRLLEVVTVYWKSRKRIGFMTYEDQETGQVEEVQVDEGFRMPAELREQGARVEYKWVNEVWQGTKIDGRFFININPVANQRTSLDNPSACKLPINGRRYSDVNSRNISLVSLGIPYQLTYNIYKYRMELSIARSKDIIAQFDINMIPKKWDMDKFMYYVEGTGIAWVDYNKEGIALNPQHQSVLDMSIKTIQQYVTLLESILIEWEKLAGVNRQRQGQVGPYDGKAASQQAIVQSSHITEDLFRKFARFEEKDLQALLDYSKEAWLTGKKGMFVMPDGTTDFLDIESMSHLESEYGVFVSNSGKDMDKLEGIRQLTQALVQNGLPISEVAELLDADNFSTIKSNIKAAERQREALQAQQQQAEQEMAAQQQQQVQQLESAKLENDNLNREKDRQLQLRVAMINNADSDKAAGFNMEKAMRELDLKERELTLKEREITAKIASGQRQDEIKDKEASAKIKAANNKNKSN